MNTNEHNADELDLESKADREMETELDSVLDFDAAHASSSAEPITRDEQMEAMRRQVDDANKRVLMAQADSENFRKRMRRDYEDQLKYASLALVKDVLQVRDNMNRAIEASAGGAGGVDSLSDGVAICVKQLDDTLAKYGVTAIDDSGEFDPNVHEAISQMPSPQHDAGAIAHVAVPGFMMHERVVRPSQVVVSTGKP